METGIPEQLPWQQPLLQQALDLQRANRLPHAVLMETPSDLGMEASARYLAMLLLCDQPKETTLCGTCEACRMMAAGTYADFSMVTLMTDEKTKKISKNIKIEQIRHLIHELSLTRKYDRLKIALIFPADLMSPASANALLKTLEEPSPGVLLILVTHSPGRIPVTLRSRCQHWKIDPPTMAQARAWLEQHELDSETIETCLQHAAGDPLLALELQQQDFATAVDEFKRNLAAYLRSQQGVSELSRSLAQTDPALSRRLVDMTLNAYSSRALGAIQSESTNTTSDRHAARELLDLRQRAWQQLQVEENNLDFQLQLEDVLISLKHTVTRRQS